MMDQPNRLTIAQRLDLEHITRTEFINAMVHLYRVSWARPPPGATASTHHQLGSGLSATALSFVFSDNNIERHVLIPIISFFCTFFLLIEARRYRFFDLWRSRARMIEINSTARCWMARNQPCQNGRMFYRTIWNGPFSYALVGSGRSASEAQLPVDLRRSV